MGPRAFPLAPGKHWPLTRVGYLFSLRVPPNDLHLWLAAIRRAVESDDSLEALSKIGPRCHKCGRQFQTQIELEAGGRVPRKITFHRDCDHLPV